MCKHICKFYIRKLKKIWLDAFSFLCEVVVDVTFQQKSSRIEKNEGLKRQEWTVDQESFVGWTGNAEGQFKIDNYKVIVKAAFPVV